MAIAIMLMTLAAGCQQAPSTVASKPTESWRVMERVGEVRAARVDGLEARSIRPGETIAGGLRVTTGPGALAILAKGGIQMTLGEISAIELPGPAPSAGLLLDHGWLRLRLATAADDEARISTDHFGISASRAIVTLSAGPDGTDLSVEGGSAVLATIDGRHHATLVAGAAAKMTAASGGDLLIRPASGRAFTKVTPFKQDRTGDADTIDGSVADRPRKESASGERRSLPAEASKARLAKAGPTGGDFLIRPASRLKPADDGPPQAMAAAGLSAIRPRPSPEPAPSADMAVRPPVDDRPVTLSMPEIRDSLRPTGQAGQATGRSDTVRSKFDRMTEGLVDGL